MFEIIIFKIIFVFIFGICIGSFLNVLILRLPNEEDVVFKPSHCIKCDSKIKWYENLPLVSFIFLKGKCSNCKTPILLQYPLVELLMGIIAVLLIPKFISTQTMMMFTFKFSIISVFLVHFIIDLRHKILPDSLNIYLASIFFCYSIFYNSWSHILYGAGIGFFFPLGITWLFYLLKGQVGLGGGDIKLYGALGIFLGPYLIVQNIFLSCFLGSIIGGALILTKIISRTTPIPFGPFILVISFIQIFFPELIELLPFI